jgi:hypothetical protein
LFVTLNEARNTFFLDTLKTLTAELLCSFSMTGEKKEVKCSNIASKQKQTNIVALNES